jgi:hypothetical protein
MVQVRSSSKSENDKGAKAEPFLVGKGSTL